MKKKLSTGKVLLIGGGVLAAAYAVYEFVIKPKQASGGGSTETQDVPPGFTPGQSSNMQNLINSADNVQPNVMPELSPLNTPDSKLQYDLMLKKGDKGGEIQKLQKISNVVSGIYKTNKLTVDGQFGNLTLNKLKSQFGREQITLRTALNFMEAIKAWDKFGRIGQWSKYVK